MVKRSLFNYWFLYLVIIGVTLTSCTVSFEKRRYNAGYHVEVVKHTQPSKPLVNKLNARVSKFVQEVVVLSSPDTLRIPDLQRIQPAKGKELMVKPKPTRPLYRTTFGECDMVYFKNGKSMMVTNVRVVEDKLYYSNCGDNTNKVVPVNISKIKNIKLADGTVIDPNADYKKLQQKNVNKNVKKTKPAARITFAILMAILGVILLALGILSIVAGYGGGFVGFFFIILGVIAIVPGIALLVTAIITLARG